MKQNHNKSGTQMVMLLLGGLLIFLLSISFLTVQDAREIRDTLTETAQEEYLSLSRRLEAIAATDFASDSEALAACQSAMVSADNAILPDQMLSTSALYGTKHEVRPRNGLICRFMDWEGNETVIPMVFSPENTADAAQALFCSQYSVSPSSSSMHYTTFTGYLEDEFFVLTKIQTDYDLYSYAPMNQRENCISITAGAGRSNADYQSVTVTPLIKSYGGTNYRTTSFVSGWNKTDELTEKLIACGKNTNFEYWGNYSGIAQTQVKPALQHCFQVGGLFTTRILARNRHLALPLYCEGFQTRDYTLAYATEFHPISLALKGLVKNGTLFLLLLSDLLGAILLYLMIKRSYSGIIQSQKDEIARQAQALSYARDAEESRKSMTSAIAHELKTPLAVLSTYTEAITENIDPEKQSYYLSVIQEESARMDRMVMELLDLSRLEAGKYHLDRQPFDLKALTEEILSPLEPQLAEQQLQVSYQVEELMVCADRSRIGQVVENYLTNALRYATPGSTLHIRIGMGRETFSVENQGSPIPPEQLSKVWDAFWQGDKSRNQRGTGLGLAICKTILELHGGSCRAENTARGVRFSFSLSGDTKTQVISRLPRESEIPIDYPIAQEHTTVRSVMEHLSLLHGKALRRELKAGNILCGTDRITSPRHKLYPGYILIWKEFRITICLQNDQKRNAIMVDAMRPGGGLGYVQNRNTSMWVGH